MEELLKQQQFLIHKNLTIIGWKIIINRAVILC